ncbi:MAG: hypothetical protein ACK5NY_03465 [Burkholderiaceae bacterium]
MNVAQIVTLIAQQSLNESSPDVDMQNRIVGYVNRAYEAVYAGCAAWQHNKLLVSQTVAVTNGTGTLNPVPFKIAQITDTTNNRILPAVDILELEERDPALATTGAPLVYWIEQDSTLKTYPLATHSVRVRYVPKAATLSNTSAEADIKLPAEYHSVLVFGALFYMFMDEADLRSQQEIAINEAKFNEALASLKMYLASASRDYIRIKHQDM